MRRGRRETDGTPVGAGDWSSTGTFLRKPPTGWLHEDRELMSGSCIDYEVQYIGCIEVKQSMRTLQFSVRTQVTKEAIFRLAESVGKVYGGKKKKTAKQINKVLGGIDSRSLGDMTLSVSVDALKISNLTGTQLFNHSLPSISFASGGDGPTVDFIGYVAKDPVNGRACHVFECPNSSQYVLATIGQAFELRYKLYLKSSPHASSQPVEVNDSWQSSNFWRQSTNSSSTHDSPPVESIVTQAPPTPPPAYAGLQDNPSAAIYSDILDFPPPDVPPPRPHNRLEGVHSNKPAGQAKFPPDIEPVNQVPSSPLTSVNQRLENPYDTMPSDTQFTDAAMYSEPGQVFDNRTSDVYDDHDLYSRHLMTIKQTSTSDSSSDQIDLTPHTPIPDYTNLGPNGKINSETTPLPLKPPRPPITASKPSVGSPKRKKPTPLKKPLKLQSRQSSEESAPHAVDYDDPVALSKVHTSSVDDTYHDIPNTAATYDDIRERHTAGTRRGTYDDIREIGTHRGTYDDIGERHSPSTRRGTYDDIREVIGFSNGHDGRRGSGNPPVSNGVQSLPEHVYDPVNPGLIVSSAPKFDDTIYNRLPVSDNTGFKNMGDLAAALPNPLSPLPHQQYFHGQISRTEAEALLVADGEFLVRESTKKTGQYVLTGMASGRIQHLLLMDKHGKVKSKDREFESIPGLVEYFREKQSALVIGTSQVYLRKPVVNAFMS